MSYHLSLCYEELNPVLLEGILLEALPQYKKGQHYAFHFFLSTAISLQLTDVMKSVVSKIDLSHNTVYRYLVEFIITEARYDYSKEVFRFAADKFPDVARSSVEFPDASIANRIPLLSEPLCSCEDYLTRRAKRSLYNLFMSNPNPKNIPRHIVHYFTLFADDTSRLGKLKRLCYERADEKGFLISFLDAKDSADRFIVLFREFDPWRHGRDETILRYSKLLEKIFAEDPSRVLIDKVISCCHQKCETPIVLNSIAYLMIYSENSKDLYSHLLNKIDGDIDSYYNDVPTFTFYHGLLSTLLDHGKCADEIVILLRSGKRSKVDFKGPQGYPYYMKNARTEQGKKNFIEALAIVEGHEYLKYLTEATSYETLNDQDTDEASVD